MTLSALACICIVSNSICRSIYSIIRLVGTEIIVKDLELGHKPRKGIGSNES